MDPGQTRKIEFKAFLRGAIDAETVLSVRSIEAAPRVVAVEEGAEEMLWKSGE